MEGRGEKGKELEGRDYFSAVWLEKIGGKGKEIKSTVHTNFNPPKLNKNEEKGFENYNFAY